MARTTQLTDFNKVADNEEYLDRVENELIDRGALNSGDMQTWHFDELYHANPEELPADMRQLQIEAWNSPDNEHLRQRFNLPCKGQQPSLEERMKKLQGKSVRDLASKYGDSALRKGDN